MRTLPNLPATIAREAYASLCGVLPPPAIDTPETRAARDDEAMAAVAILRPADAFEARLAVDVVTAEAHARDCLRLAAKYCNDVTTALRCRAQFAVMMRQMQSALRTLQRMQAARQDTDAASAPGDDQRPQPTSPGLDERQAIPDPAVPDRVSQPDPLKVAEDFAVQHPLLAGRVRAAGGLPPEIMAELDLTTDPAIVDARVNGTSPILSALDQIASASAPAA